jgi:2,4-dienoyl-CoA reductase-like NADH-dependent reductase (Old Yellow Enzyme family)
MSQLFSPLTLRGLTLRNRVGVSPMCQYSADDGLANTWHLAHLGSRAVGGAGLVIAEATAVEPRGRISPGDLGLWSAAHAEALAPVAAFISAQGAAPGIQLAHAGRKASTARPWEGGGPLGAAEAWPIIAPSALPFTENHATPQVMTNDDIAAVTHAFAEAAARAVQVGFTFIEIHAAHGYLLHSFLSPLANQRSDDYGGDFANRVRFVLEVTDAVRAVLPERCALAVRLSATDWVEGGWTVEDSVELAILLKAHGVDLIDCSSGGIRPGIKIPTAPGYQVPFAEAVRQGANVPTAAVGLITEPAQAEAVIAEGRADLVLLARAVLRNPHWPLMAAAALGAPAPVPVQYARAF